jgi:hypothetical protein
MTAIAEAPHTGSALSAPQPACLICATCCAGPID